MSGAEALLRAVADVQRVSGCSRSAREILEFLASNGGVTTPYVTSPVTPTYPTKTLHDLVWVFDPDVFARVVCSAMSHVFVECVDPQVPVELDAIVDEGIAQGRLTPNAHVGMKAGRTQWRIMQASPGTDAPHKTCKQWFEHALDHVLVDLFDTTVLQHKVKEALQAMPGSKQRAMHIHKPVRGNWNPDLDPRRLGAEWTGDMDDMIRFAVVSIAVQTLCARLSEVTGESGTSLSVREFDVDAFTIHTNAFYAIVLSPAVDAGIVPRDQAVALAYYVSASVVDCVRKGSFAHRHAAFLAGH